MLKGLLHTQKGENQLLLGFRKARVMEPLGQTPEAKDKKKTIDINLSCFSNLNRQRNHFGSLIKYRFQFSQSGTGQRFCIPN